MVVENGGALFPVCATILNLLYFILHPSFLRATNNRKPFQMLKKWLPPSSQMYRFPPYRSAVKCAIGCRQNMTILLCSYRTPILWSPRRRGLLIFAETARALMARSFLSRSRSLSTRSGFLVRVRVTRSTTLLPCILDSEVKCEVALGGAPQRVRYLLKPSVSAPR